MQEFGLYVHIPFCRQKCFYCDFPSFAGRGKYIPAYLQALEQELAYWQCQVNGTQERYLQPRTLYIGGGTPTALNEGELEQLLELLKRHIDMHACRELTIEANPGTLDFPKLKLLREAGINRLSLGVQSFQDELLKRIGRIHTAEQAEMAVREAKNAGFANISIDLMYGLPEQNMVNLQDSVDRALQLGVQHISIYGLQLEEGTAFAKQAEQGRLNLPSPELVEKMYDYITSTLPAHGYQRYEISNFAQPGYESRHNLSYWQDIPYIGIGSGAHSYWQNTRYQNSADIPTYIEEMQQEIFQSHVEENLDEKAHMEEYSFLALRTSTGISAQYFFETFGKNIYDVYGKTIDSLCEEKLLHKEGNHISLTALGMKYGNQVFAEFLL